MVVDANLVSFKDSLNQLLLNTAYFLVISLLCDFLLHFHLPVSITPVVE